MGKIREEAARKLVPIVGADWPEKAEQSKGGAAGATEPSLAFSSAVKATKANRLIHAIGELKDLSYGRSPAPEIPTSIMEILAAAAYDLLEEAEGFHFYEEDGFADRIEHVEGELVKATKELGVLKRKAENS